MKSRSRQLRSDTHHKMRVWLAAEWNIGIRFSKMRLFSTEFPYRKETFRPVSRNRFPRRGPRKNGSAYLIRCFRFLFAEFLEARIHAALRSSCIRICPKNSRYCFGASDLASFWKRGSFRRGSNIGSSRSSAGVSGMPTANEPPLGIESTF